jgi:predicted glycoside hydrolase/deacetylase ChbG (UPF0249 family)
LLDPDKKLWRNVPDVVQHAPAADVEKEIRAQIEKSIAMGYRPDHIDTHMGTLYGHVDYMRAVFKVAEEYNIPANVIDLSKPEVLAVYQKQGYPLDAEAVKVVSEYSLPKLDFFAAAPDGKSYEDKVENFKKLVQSLPPGLIEIIFHPSTDTENLKTITGSWQQRVWESQMFDDPAIKQFLQQEGVIFTNWLDIMKRFSESK